VFATRGLSATLDDIAAHAGVGIGTVYRRYANKEELIEALFTLRVEAIATLAEEALTVPDPWAGLTGFMEQVCQLTAADQGLREILFHGQYGHDHVAAARNRLLPVTSALMLRARHAGQLRPDVEPLDFPLLMNMLEAVIEFTRSLDAEYWRRSLGVILAGLRTDQVPATLLPGRPMTQDELDALVTKRHTQAGDTRAARRT
jgi:AcrR family transcriptional regulator